MIIPIVGPILAKFVGRKVAWRVLKWSVVQAAKEFSKNVDPVKHGKLSRRWFWNNAFQPLINDIRNNKTKLDDPAAEYIYQLQAGYLDDDRLAEILRTVKTAIARGETVDALQQIQSALTLIELPEKK